MRKLLIIIAILFTTTVMAKEQQEVKYQQDETIVLWDNSKAPHSNGLEGEAYDAQPYRLVNTTKAVLYVYNADQTKATGQAVVICPGGGYGAVCIEREGFKLAEYFKSIGVTALVLKYRLPNYGHKEVPLEDAQAALAYLRKNAKKLGFDPAKVGIAGSSAGGHLAAYTSTFTPDAEKPAFAVLFYPVISAVDCMTHQGTFDQLLGKQQPAYLRDYYSLENRVTPTTPPTILILSTNDRTVPPVSSIRYYKALKYNGVDAAMHIYPEGGHGWVCNESFRYHKDWQHQLAKWLKFINTPEKK